VETQVRESITNETKIQLAAYVITPQAEEFLKSVLDAILEKYAAADLKMTGYVVLKELTTNAVKANLKHLLRMQKGRATDQSEAEFLAEFRQILSSGGALPFRNALKDAGLRVDIAFEFEEQKVILSVSNSFSLESEEKKRLAEKLQHATGGGDMRKFFEQNRRGAEGAGLGFTMVINALKSSGIDPGAFTFDMNGKDTTTARVAIPVAGIIH
jgi:hypothetical protein